MKLLLAISLMAVQLSSFGLSQEDSKIYQQLEKKLKGQRDTIRRTVKRKGDKTIELEAFISTELDLELAKSILTDFSGYNAWALRDINKKPDGGQYMLQLLSMLPAPEQNDILILRYKLDVPLFNMTGHQTFKMNATEKDGTMELSAKANPQKDSVIDWAQGVAKIFPAPGLRNRVWVYAIGTMRFHPWLMYEALPDRLLNRLVSNRIKTFLDNLLEEQDKKALSLGPPSRPLAAEK